MTNAPTTQSNLSGTIYHTQYPSQATRIIQNTTPVIFGPNSTLTCNVSFNVLRPAPGDPFCRSSELDPSRLENLALMDVSQFYSSSVPWPPSGTYNASTPVTVAQPSPLANWSTVSVKLPKCYRLILNKRVNPGLTWPPGGTQGGPALNYTIDVTNAGDTLTGSPGTNGWNGLLLGDAFLPPFNFVPPASPAPSLVSVGYTCPPQTPPLPPLQVIFSTPLWSGAPAGNLSFLPVTSFPAGCTIHVMFQVAGTFKPSLPGQPLNQICNRAGAGMVPMSSTGGTDTADWYANIPDPNLLSMKVCVPVLQTNKLTIKKTLINNAGAVLPPGMTYPMSVSCTIPNPGGSPPVITTASANINVAINGVSLPNSIPVGSTCSANEHWSQLPVPGQSKCKRPQVPAWQVPSYSPTNLQIVAPPADNIITVTNTLDCVTPPVNTLTVEKTFDPATVVSQLPPDAVFPVEVVCDPFPTGTLTLTATAWQQFMANIPVGTLCKIRELPPEGTKIPEDCRWVQTYPNGNDVVIPAQGNPTLVVQNSLICKPDLAITKTGPTPTSMSGLYYLHDNRHQSRRAVHRSQRRADRDGQLHRHGRNAARLLRPRRPSSDWDCLTSPGTCAYTGTGPTVAGQVLGTFRFFYLEYYSRGIRELRDCLPWFVFGRAGIQSAQQHRMRSGRENPRSGRFGDQEDGAGRSPRLSRPCRLYPDGHQRRPAFLPATQQHSSDGYCDRNDRELHRHLGDPGRQLELLGVRAHRDLHLPRLWRDRDGSGAWNDHHHLPFLGARKLQKLRQCGAHHQCSAAGNQSAEQPGLRHRLRHQKTAAVPRW